MSPSVDTLCAVPFEDLLTLLKNHGRLPRLGDNPAPWSYRGRERACPKSCRHKRSCCRRTGCRR